MSAPNPGSPSPSPTPKDAVSWLTTLAGCQNAKPAVDQSGQPPIIAESAKNLEGMPYHVKSTTTITGDPGGAPDLSIVTEGDVATPRRAARASAAAMRRPVSSSSKM